jgi:signal peptidase I
VIELRGEQLVLNGTPVEEPYVFRRDRGGQEPSRTAGEDFGPHAVPAGRYFVLGDNRGGSMDSRVWGSVPAHTIVGRVYRRYLPLGRSGPLR